MKVTALAAMLMVASTGADAARWSGSVDTVQICSEGTTDIKTWQQARGIATKMFAGIGVIVEWHVAPSCPAGALRISHFDHSSANQMWGPLAFATLYDGTHNENTQIVIFDDRVRAVAIEPHSVAPVLALVMTHEVTHLLEGVARHSAEGVMKARWTREDFSRMRWLPLQFDDESIALIHSGLRRRTARSNSAQSVTIAETAVLIGGRTDAEFRSEQ
jgi:hypothetical protein